MMKYLCLIYHDEKAIAAMPRDDHRTIVEETRTYRDVLRASGRCIDARDLEPVETATTIRVRNGWLSITDGPFAATRVQLGGYYLIDATDLNDAIRIAARMPPARLGCIEIRPIKELTDLAGWPPGADEAAWDTAG